MNQAKVPAVKDFGIYLMRDAVDGEKDERSKGHKNSPLGA